VNPLSAIYAGGVGVKNRLYNSGVLKSRTLRGPVVSIGNLSVGGSGKTPFVILLGELLKQRGIAFDVLSRGYGRNTRGVLEVEVSGSPHRFGDEPLLIARHLNCPVVVEKAGMKLAPTRKRNSGPNFTSSTMASNIAHSRATSI